MTRAQPWMPEQCLRDERVARAVGQTVSAWVQAWFVQMPWNVVGAWEPEDWPRDGWSTLREGGRVGLRGNASAIQAIAFAVLGEPARSNLTTRDLRLLRRLASDALDDLVARLESVLPKGTGPDGPVQQRWSLALAMAGEPILGLSLERADVCLLARRTFDPTHAAEQLEPAVSALTGVSIPVAAQIGRASLPIDQTGALEPGDILVLDREVDDPVDLVVAGLQSSLRGSLADVDGGIGLIVCEPK